ncbi:hypothetical protein TNCV_4851001 [Trichonephila clavipes]|nr:hypothetical protein TNCV_4851001 [Trichonephila clavipes]
MSNVYSNNSKELPFTKPVLLSEISLKDGVEIAVFSYKSRFRFGSSDDHVLVRRKPEEFLQPNCLQPRRRTGPILRVMV